MDNTKKRLINSILSKLQELPATVLNKLNDDVDDLVDHSSCVNAHIYI